MKIVSPEEFLKEKPKPIKVPAEYGIVNPINDLESQLGSIGAYNLLVAYCAKLRAKIESGDAKVPMPVEHFMPRNTNSK